MRDSRTASTPRPSARNAAPASAAPERCTRRNTDTGDRRTRRCGRARQLGRAVFRAGADQRTDDSRTRRRSACRHQPRWRWNCRRLRWLWTAPPPLRPRRTFRRAGAGVCASWPRPALASPRSRALRAPVASGSDARSSGPACPAEPQRLIELSGWHNHKILHSVVRAALEGLFGSPSARRSRCRSTSRWSSNAHAGAAADSSVRRVTLSRGLTDPQTGRPTGRGALRWSVVVRNPRPQGPRILLSSTRKRDMTNTVIIGVLLGIVLLGVFGTLVPLIFFSFVTLGVGAAVLRGGRRLASRRHAGKRLKA